MPLQSAKAPILPMDVVRVGGRRSVNSFWPPIVSIIQRPAMSGLGSAGRVRNARVPSLAMRMRDCSLGFSHEASWSRNVRQCPFARREDSRVGRGGGGALAGARLFPADNGDGGAVEPVESGKAAAAARAVIEEAAFAEINPALEAAEIGGADALERPLPAERINAGEVQPSSTALEGSGAGSSCGGGDPAGTRDASHDAAAKNAIELSNRITNEQRCARGLAPRPNARLHRYGASLRSRFPWRRR